MNHRHTYTFTSNPHTYTPWPSTSIPTPDPPSNSLSRSTQAGKQESHPHLITYLSSKHLLQYHAALWIPQLHHPCGPPWCLHGKLVSNILASPLLPLVLTALACHTYTTFPPCIHTDMHTHPQPVIHTCLLIDQYTGLWARGVYY